MTLNFREALAALAHAFPAYLYYAVALIFGGLVILLEFGFFLVAIRLARVERSMAAPLLFGAILLGGWLTLLAWQRLFLFRRQAVMLCLFSKDDAGQAQAMARRLFPSFSAWSGCNRRLRQALQALVRDGDSGSGPTRGFVGRMAATAFSPAIFSLSFARGGETAAITEALALYWRHGQKTRSLGERWLWFSVAGFVLLFLCLALANALVFSGAGAPIAIGVALAAVIAWAIHQAFVAPLALAGVSASLLDETRSREPDDDLCARISPLLTP